MVVHMAIPNYVDDAGFTVIEAVAAEVRASMARKRVNGRQLAKALRKSEAWVSRRINGDVPFNVVELAQVAKLLDTTVSELTQGARIGYFLHDAGNDPILTLHNGWSQGSGQRQLPFHLSPV